MQDLALTRLKESSEVHDKLDNTILESLLYDFQEVCLAIQPRQLSNIEDLDFITWIDLCSMKASSGPRDLVFGFWGCCPSALDVKEEDIEDFALVLRPPQTAWLPDLPATLTQIAKSMARCTRPNQTRSRTILERLPTYIILRTLGRDSSTRYLLLCVSKLYSGKSGHVSFRHDLESKRQSLGIRCVLCST